MPPKRHVPIRTCVVCRRKGPKRDLVRIVAAADGTAQIDTAGKLRGRGAYVCEKDLGDLHAPERARLSYALRVSVTDENWSDLVHAMASIAENSVD